MRNDCGLDLVVECEIENVASSEAVTSGSEYLDTAFLESGNDFVKCRTGVFWPVGLKPCPNIELLNLQSINSDG